MIEDLFHRYLQVTDDPVAAATLVLAHVTEAKPVAEGAISVRDASRVLGVSEDTVGRLCRDGLLKHKRVGRSIRISRPDLDEYMKDIEQLGKQPLRCLR